MSRHNDTGNDTSDEGGANQSDISNNQDDRQQYLDWAGTMVFVVVQNKYFSNSLTELFRIYCI